MTSFTFLICLIFSLVNTIAGNSTSTTRKRLPIDQCCVESCNEFELSYVDKTEFALKLIKSGKRDFLFLRPRRFGKTFFLNTLDSILRGKQDVFKDYFIGDPQNGYTWETYTVLRLTFNQYDPVVGLADRLVGITKGYDIGGALAHIEETNPLYFEILLRELSPNDVNGNSKPGNKPPLALLIDEYDLPLKNSNDEIREYFYSLFARLKKLADENIVQFIFLTGCNKATLLPDASSTLRSAPNTTLLIRDISLDPNYASVCGFTRDEIEKYFHLHVQEIADTHNVTPDTIYKEIEHWYYGYRFTSDPELVYNPISILGYLEDKHIRYQRNYWIHTVNHPQTLLEALIEARLRNKCTILDVKTRYTEHELFQPLQDLHVPKQALNATLLKTLPSLESILFQNGYLTIHEHDDKRNLYTLKFSNMETMETILHGVELAMEKDEECCALHRKAKRSLQNLKVDKFVKIFNTFLNAHYSVLVEANTKEHEAMLKSILASLLTLDPSSRCPTPEWNVCGEDRMRMLHRKKGTGFLIETSMYRIEVKCKYKQINAKLEKGDEPAVSDKLPVPESGSNKILIRLSFTFDEDGIVYWTGAKYDAKHNFIENLSPKNAKKKGKLNRMRAASSDRFRCDQCRPARNFATKASLIRHIGRAHSNKTFNCDTPNCDRVFESKRSLARHQRVHKNASSAQNFTSS